MTRSPSPTRSPVRAAGRGVSPSALGAGDSSYSIRFGIILDINGYSVPITSADLANAKTNGVEFTLQNPIDLSTIDKFETWVGDQFGVSLPKATDLPPPLDKVVGVITGMEITVEKAHVKIPGSSTPSQSVALTLEVNGTFQPEISLITGKLGIQGMVFGFSNEAAES
jgi:hypothetical protein